jgi:hypothetical protein
MPNYLTPVPDGVVLDGDSGTAFGYCVACNTRSINASDFCDCCGADWNDPPLFTDDDEEDDW